MAKRLVIANWKMRVQTPAEARAFALALKRKVKALAAADAWVAPPFTLLPTMPKGPYKLGAQALSPFSDGAHTGEVSAGMLKAVGAHFCIVGHSERRAMGEDDESVQAELTNALRAGLFAVLCVGEAERAQDGSHFGHIESQITSALRESKGLTARLVVAYEPVWAIGKGPGGAMAPQDVEEMVIFIKKILAEALGRASALKVPILYGGSVDGAGAPALLTSGVNGFLVGGASVDAGSFAEILLSCRG